MLRDSTPPFVGLNPSLHRSVTLYFFLWSLASSFLPKWSSDLKYGRCPPERDWGSHVSLAFFLFAFIPTQSSIDKTTEKQISRGGFKHVFHPLHVFCLSLSLSASLNSNCHESTCQKTATCRLPKWEMNELARLVAIHLLFFFIRRYSCCSCCVH